MSALIGTSIEGRLGIVTLDRPAAINALNLEMIDDIAETMVAWRDDAGVAAVLFRGNGPRGFCAGGDVRAIRSHVLAGEMDAADGYFAAEYGLNGLIASYPKPTIALTHGAVMGGGIGIAGHCRYRLTTPDARFAMPESAIGFVVDTGVNAILAQTTEARALLFALAGLPVGAPDALALGLADAIIAEGRVDELISDLIVASTAGDVDTAIVGLMQAESIEAGEAVFCQLADGVSPDLAAGTAGEIVAALTARSAAVPELQPVTAALALRSPTSLEAILQSQRRARGGLGVEAVLEQDLAIARYLARRVDFAEGVRAVLIDKDFAPRWEPSGFDAVPVAEIAECLAGTGQFGR